MRTDPKRSDREPGRSRTGRSFEVVDGDPSGRSKKRLGAVGGRNRPAIRITPTGKASSFRLLSVAGSALRVTLCFGIGGLLWLQSVRKPQTELLADWDKQPRLILENGEQILLGGEQEVKPEEGTRNFVIDRRKKNIVYTNRQGGEQKKWQYNTLEVPRGAEYVN